MREERALGNRRAAGAGQLRSAPGHRSESPTGYSSAGCSPAEPASASPVTDNSSSILIQRGNQIRCSTFTAAMQFRSRSSCPPPTGGVISTLRAGCHFYLAPTGASRISAILESSRGLSKTLVFESEIRPS